MGPTPQRNVILIRDEVEHSEFVDRPLPGASIGSGDDGDDEEEEDAVAATMLTAKSLVRGQGSVADLRQLSIMSGRAAANCRRVCVCLTSMILCGHGVQ